MGDARRILVVEDWPETRESFIESIKHEFGSDAFEFLEAADAEPAIQLLKRGLPDVMLLDLGLAHSEGWEVLEYLKANHLSTSVYVIVVSRFDQQNNPLRTIRAGARDFVSKKEWELELIPRLKHALQRIEEEEARDEARDQFAEFVFRIHHSMVNLLSKRARKTLNDLQETPSLGASVVPKVQALSVEFDEMQRDLDDLLHFYEALKSGTSPTIPIELNIALTIREQLREITNDTSIKTKVNMPDRVMIEGDKWQLGILFHNIFENAQKAIEMKKATGEISVSSAEVENNAVRIIIEDNGIGFSPDRITKQFGFVKGTRSGWGGTGIGLETCYEIVKTHNGTIRLNNGANGGASITIELPKGLIPNKTDSND